MEPYELTYPIDLVFCIDATGSMRHVLDMVKHNATRLHEDIQHAMEKKHRNISKMRIRVIAFRDYLTDGDQAMMASDFFTLPEQTRQFYDCVNGITAQGGGDIPEDGMEALAYAIRSDWTREGIKRRHIIVVWSDAPTHTLGHAKIAPWYPEGMGLYSVSVLQIRIYGRWSGLRSRYPSFPAASSRMHSALFALISTCSNIGSSPQ